ncbi:HPP family protein [Methylobacterium organophilum]|uniref:HPP family protein n=1 Tax=Methylobacterium organophilum TaxID=410 RepID=UPI001F13CB2C|nr:HPP family protein [Methylobacterium organophilum]UMY19738.1 HPP family protein [Methylobacterium organophilum]
MPSSRLSRLLPQQAPVSLRERVRAACGALLGLLVTGLVSRAALGSGAEFPVMVAPMGASAVLLFAVPASPLAQPWSILGGNLIAALVGVTVAAHVPDPLAAAAIAGGGAIGLMLALRCLHPPSGAVALTAVLGGPAIHDLGYGFVFWPLGVNTLLLLASAVLFNTLTGRTYPHGASIAPAAPQAPGRAGLAASDIDAALKDFDQVLDIDRGDLEAILQRAQLRALLRRSGPATCASLLTRDVVAIAPDTPLREALQLLRRHHIKMLPVTDESARVLGVLTQTDLMDKAEWHRKGPRLGLARRLRLTVGQGRAPHGCAADVMTTSVESLKPEMALAEVAVRMAQGPHHHLPVVGPEGRLLGVVSQTDLIATLVAEAATRGTSPLAEAAPNRARGAEGGLLDLAAGAG